MASIRLSSRVDKFLVRPLVVASLSWPDRGHHVPALTVTSGGRVSGFTCMLGDVWWFICPSSSHLGASVPSLHLHARCSSFVRKDRRCPDLDAESRTGCWGSLGANSSLVPRHANLPNVQVQRSEWPRASCSSSHVGGMSGHTANSLVALVSACWWLSLVWLGAGASGICFLVFLALVLLACLGASGFLFPCMRATGPIVSAAASGC